MADTIATVFNPLTGVFGSGNVRFFPGNSTTQTYTWTVPAGVDAVRARVWGGGGYNGGSGGGFAMESIYGISGTTSILITVGTGGSSGTTTGGTSSFGSFVSATGGATAGGTEGAGSGGDVNYTGGLGVSGGGGGGVAGLFGNGGRAGTTVNSGQNGNSGGGCGTTANNLSGGHGIMGAGGIAIRTTSFFNVAPTTGLETDFSIDFIGTGGGGAINQSGVNGGGGGYSGTANVICHGGYPGGGTGAFTTSTLGRGGAGLVIVEW